MAVPPVTDVKKCSYYDEELFSTRIMKWALNVHAFYYRGTHERASREEIRDSFESDVYNLNSSVRSALSIRYKLGAAGIETDCDSPGAEFYRRVAASEAEAGKLIDILSDQNRIVITGKNLTITRLLEDEVLIKGKFEKIEFR